MAWVQVGPHKINTALICYVEQEGDTVRIYFHGEWEGNPLDLHFDEAKMFWRHVKAEDVMMATRDKGSATVLPRVGSGSSSPKSSGGMYDVDLGAEKPADKPKPTASPAAQSHPPHKPGEHRRH
jgi:hypothetical protein